MHEEPYKPAGTELVTVSELEQLEHEIVEQLQAVDGAMRRWRRAADDLSSAQITAWNEIGRRLGEDQG